MPWIPLNRAFAHHHTTALAFLVGTALQTLIVSFTALATAPLYYDLRHRREILAMGASAEAPGLAELTAEGPTASTTRASTPVPLTRCGGRGGSYLAR